jgi:hypothetical protein
VPGDDSANIDGEVEFSHPEKDGPIDSVFQVSATATQPQQIADEIRRVASEVCSQGHLIASLTTD